MIRRNLILIVALFFGAVNLQAIYSNPDDIFGGLCLKNKEYLLNLEKSKGILIKQKLNRLGVANYQFESEKIQKLLKKREKGYKLTVEEKEKMLRLLKTIGTVNTYNGMLYYSPVIEDDIITKIIISALKSNSLKIKKNSGRYIGLF